MSKPWYREPWPWILMSGPAVVVVAGIITTALAVSTSDGVVADDYYKQGLGINRVIERDARAAALGVTAMVQFNEPRDRVRVLLTGAEPRILRLRLLHPTRAGADQSVELQRTGPSVYEGAIQVGEGRAWHVRVEDGDSQWRLAGDWKSADNGVALAAR